MPLTLKKQKGEVSDLTCFYCFEIEVFILLDDFMCILWNIYTYFSQFTNIVIAKIKEIRSPIEKKLKDYVKIVRWKDISYWAIKETLQKTHRTLHKYMRDFRNILNQRVSPYLVNYITNDVSNIGIWDRPQRRMPKDYHYTMDSSCYVAKQAKVVHIIFLPYKLNLNIMCQFVGLF